MVLDIETLLAPLPGEDPAGADMRLDTSGGGAYYRLKDARSAARIAERQADAESERGALAPEWRFIFEHAQSVLASQSKDLEIACWLTEAALRIHGFAGLRDATALLAGLVDRYWPGLHSVDGDDLAAKVAPLANLNGVGADGSLIQPMRLALHGPAPAWRCNCGGQGPCRCQQGHGQPGFHRDLSRHIRGPGKLRLDDGAT
jgi:type VI secretion system protein ImpA